MILKGKEDIELVSFDECAEDLELKKQYLIWLNDLEVVTPIMSNELMNPNKGLDFIEESFKRFTKEDAKGFFIRYLPLEKMLGTIKLDKIDFINKSAEVGALIGEKDFWGKKIGQKAFSILLKYSFEDLGLNRIWGGTDENNKSMQGLFLKSGFLEEGRLRQITYFEGKYTDNLRYSILREEYFKK